MEYLFLIEPNDGISNLSSRNFNRILQPYYLIPRVQFATKNK